MTTQQAKQIIHILKTKAVQCEAGLSEEELSQVEARFAIRFPPDLRLFLQTALPVSLGFVNWRFALHSKKEAQNIKKRLAWPVNGILFDVKESNVWLKKWWGKRPDRVEERLRVAGAKLQHAPQLIPIFSHRYIPERPHEPGNPVFSVHQLDVLCYGYDLASYFANEFRFELPAGFEQRPVKTIEFWSPETWI